MSSAFWWDTQNFHVRLAPSNSPPMSIAILSGVAHAALTRGGVLVQVLRLGAAQAKAIDEDRHLVQLREHLLGALPGVVGQQHRGRDARPGRRGGLPLE